MRNWTETISWWVARFSKEAVRQTKDYKPKVGDVWVADETVLKIGGENLWVWDMTDTKTRFLLASHMSTRRTTRDAQKLMELASERAGKVPRIVLTDKLQAYLDGVEKLFAEVCVVLLLKVPRSRAYPLEHKTYEKGNTADDSTKRNQQVIGINNVINRLKYLQFFHRNETKTCRNIEDQCNNGTHKNACNDPPKHAAIIEDPNHVVNQNEAEPARPLHRSGSGSRCHKAAR